MHNSCKKSSTWTDMSPGANNELSRMEMETSMYSQELAEANCDRELIGNSVVTKEDDYECLVPFQDSYTFDSNLWDENLRQDFKHVDILREKKSQLFVDQIEHMGEYTKGARYDTNFNWARYASSNAISMSRHDERHSSKTAKRSLLSKIVHLLKPMSNSKAEVPKVSRVKLMPHSLINPPKSEKFDNGEPVQKTLIRSRTLSSKSSQNLFNNSMRFLSTSRKSMNLSPYKNKECRENNYTGRSFMNGFLTIGRRSGSATAAVMMSSQKEYKFLNKDHRMMKENQPSTLRRIYSSVDSLPSADSGLSCSNLQNQNSCDERDCQTSLNDSQSKAYSNTCSCAPKSDEDGYMYSEAYADNSILSSDDTGQVQIIGKARARVDCNPCAYDKEALVFSKGDIIDIIERHHSGTWIGRCGNQVGHFKFIHVVEVADEDSEEIQVDKATTKDGITRKETLVLGRTGHSHRVDKSSDGKKSFITKLEIKNSHNSNISRKKSQSFQVCAYDCSDVEVPTKHDGNQTIMGSLDQLLAVIGFHHCHNSSTNESEEGLTVGSNQSSQGNEMEFESERSPTKTSYLQILNENGVSSLDEFSLLEQSSDLSRFGIVNEEHQQRLLMAAKIIQQALNAARIDFHENNSVITKNSTIVNREKTRRDSEHPVGKQSDNQYLRGLSGKVNELASEQLARTEQSVAKDNQLRPRATRKIADNKELEGEPIYVNLPISPTIEPPADRGLTASEKSSSSRLSVSKSYRDYSSLSQLDLLGGLLESKPEDRDEVACNNRECETDAAREREIRENPVNQRGNEGCSKRAQRPVKQSRTMRESKEGVVAATIKTQGVCDQDSINLGDQYQTHHDPDRNYFSVAKDNTHLSRRYSSKEQSEPLVITSQIANEESVSKKPRQSTFTRGCSVRVSSRKPKNVNSRLTSINSRDAKRHSQVFPPSYDGTQYNSLVPNGRSDVCARHEKRGFAIQCERKSCAQDYTCEQPVVLSTNRDRSSMNSDDSVRVVGAYQKRLELNINSRSGTSRNNNLNNHSLLNSQIMNSKSAYDLRVNFSRFLEI